MTKSKNQMLHDLADQLPDLYACVTSALEGYRVKYAPMRHQHSPRTQASIIHDLMVHEARTRFGEKHGVNIIKKRGAILLSFSKGWLARFKKLDAAGRARFIETQATMRFVNQIPLPGTGESATNVFVGYVLHSAELRKSDTLVVCPAGREIGWAHRVEGPAAITLPRPARAAGPERKRRLVRPKARPNEAKANGSDD